MQRAILLLALLGLGGCNMVVTQAPVFGPEDTWTGRGFRQGLWDQAPNSACAFDEATPMKAWPDCAHGVAIRADTLGSFMGQADSRTLRPSHYRLVGGDPLVLQFSPTEVAGTDAKIPPVYVYIAVQPTGRDAGGRITAFRSWAVLCGPPPPPPPPASASSGAPNPPSVPSGTLNPLPGLVMDSSHVNCTTDSKAAVRNAARESRAWSPDASESHWVRDSDP